MDSQIFLFYTHFFQSAQGIKGSYKVILTLIYMKCPWHKILYVPLYLLLSQIRELNLQ
jgi:hypothetical protein